VGELSETKKCFVFAYGEEKMLTEEQKNLQNTGMRLNHALVSLLVKYSWVIEEEDEEKLFLDLFAHRKSIRDMISTKSA